MKTFAELYGESGELMYEGHRVQISYKREINRTGYVGVRFISNVENVRQALCLGMRKGTLVLNDFEKKQMILWRYKSPQYLELQCRPAKSGALLTVWNAWEQEIAESPVTMSGMGNCGIIVKDEGKKVELRCSGGVGKPNFDNLVVELYFL
jgi:hypothetical protein